MTCSIENGWKCESEPSFCYKISIPSIVQGFIDDNMFALEWNETVLLKTSWEPNNWNISMSGPLSPYDNFTWNFISENSLISGSENKTIWWEYSVDK